MKAELTLPERPAALHLLVVLDVLVLLLVFFVLLTSLAQEAGVTVRPPVSSFRLKSYGKRIVVTVRGGAEPIVYVGPRKVALKDLQEALVKSAEENGVETMFLNADEMLPYGVARQIQEIGLGLGLNVVLIGRQGGEDPAGDERAGSSAPASPGTNEKTEP